MKFTYLAFALSSVFFFASCGSEQPKEGEGDTTNEAADENVETTTLNVDTEASKITWLGSMTGVKSYNHFGELTISEGTVEVADGALKGGSFTVDMTSMVATDSNYTEEKPAAYLIQHLSDSSFFGVAQFPTASFVITKVEGNTITGDLTVRGKTNEETAEIVSSTMTEDGAMNAEAKLTFDRKKYDVAFDMSMMGVSDMFISNDIELTISVVAK